MVLRALPIVVALGCMVNVARADALSDAWLAHENLEFQVALDLARVAIESGELSRYQLAQAYTLIGRCEASVRDTEAARDAFTFALALDPDVELPEHVSPVERDPFMEAKGFWLEHDVPLTVDARESKAGWQVTVTDPAGIASQLWVLGDGNAEPLAVFEAYHDASLQIPAAQTARAVALVDGFDNRLVKLVLPQPEPQVAAATPPHPAPRAARPDEARRRKLRVAAFTQLGAGGVVALLGIPFHLSRERNVDKWNSPECTDLDPAARDAQCGYLSSRITTAERTAISLYATGGAIVASGLATWAYTRFRFDRERRVACLPAGLGALCAARF